MSLQDFFVGLQEKWEEFLEWSDENGLPFREWNDALEARGIPAMPVFALAVAVVFFVAFFLVAGFPQIPGVTVQPTATVKLTVLSEEGIGVPNALVQLKANGKIIAAKNTDSRGIVTFSDVPAGELTAVASAADFKQDYVSVTTKGGEASAQKLVLVRVSSFKVVVSFEVQGPQSANFSVWDENKTVLIDSASGATASFELEPSKNYLVRVEAPQYTPEERLVPVGTTNAAPIYVRLFKTSEPRTASLHVLVYDDKGLTGAPIANASVQVRANNSEAVIATGVTDEEGAIDAVEAPVGSLVTVYASAPGYLSTETEAFQVPEGSVYKRVRLARKTEENSKAIAVSVTTASGEYVSSPTVRLYCGGRKRDEKTPASGTTSFDAALGEKCLVTAFKEGFLPASKQVTAKGEATLVLKEATYLNSASLEVSVVDSAGNPVPMASTTVFNYSGEPLGIPEKTTGLSGTTSYYLPEGDYVVRASSGNSEGSAKTRVSFNANNSVQVKLAPLKAVAAVTVQDYYSNASIAGAKVTLKDASGATASCLTSLQGCSLEAQEGPAVVSVAAQGYEDYSGTLELRGGTTTNYSVVLVNSRVSADVKLAFLGVFDSKGRQVNKLSPATVYTARYLLKNPGIPFYSAEAFVLLGSASSSLESEDAEIIEYSADGASITAGADFSSAADFSVEATATATPQNYSQSNSSGGVAVLPSTKGTSLASNAEGWKWVKFVFPQFNGTKELRVKIRTKPVASGALSLSHRSAFATARGVLRDPEDAAAGTSKSPLLANLKPSATYEVFFAGECQNGLCVQAFLEGQQGRSADSLEALIPEQFKVRFSVASASGQATLTLSTESNALQLVDASAGATKVAAKSPAGETQELSIKSGGDGAFNVKAKAFAKDARLVLNAESGDAKYEKIFSVRVVSPKNSLKVSLKPERLIALQENTIVFKVTDTLNNPVTNARVVIGSQEDALGSTVEAGPATGKNAEPGTYVASHVSPRAHGSVQWKVEAEGYKAKSGEVDAIARKIIELSTRSLSLNADGQPASFTVSNLLENEVTVSASVAADENPQYTEFVVTPATAKLKPREEKQFQLTARPKPGVLTVAEKDSTLTEKTSGRVHVTARVAEAAQDEDARFSCTNALQRSALSSLLEYSDDALDFSLNPPRASKQSKKITITNNAPYPVLVNQQSLAPNVRVTPLSLTIPANGKAEFTVTAGLPPESANDKCIVDDSTTESDIEFYASFQGISATKVVKAKIALTASTRCYLADGLVYNLPVPVVFKFPAGTKVRGAPADDGSIPVLLPDGNKMVFFEGTSIYGPYAVERSQPYYDSSYSFDSYPQYGEYGSMVYLQTQTGLTPLQFAQSPYGSIPFYPASAAAPYYQNPQAYFGGSTQTQTQTTSVTLQQAVVPAGVGFVMSSKFARQLAIDPVTLASNAVAVTFPVVAFLELPVDARPVPDAAGVRYNLRNAYVVLPAGLPTMRAPSYGNIVQVPPGTPLLFGRTGSNYGSMELSYDEDTYIDFPRDAVVQQLPSGVQATLSECAQVKVKSLDDKMTDSTPAAKTVFVEGGTLFGANKNRVIVPAQARIKVSTCLDVTEEQQKLFCSSRRQPMTLVLPPGYRGPPSRFTIAFDSCVPMDVKGARGSQVSAVRKIYFEPTAKGQQLSSGGQQLYQVSVPEGSQLCVLPCDASGTVSVTAYGDYLDFSPKTINFTLSDSRQSAQAELCLYNTGSELLQPFNPESYVELISSPTDDEAFKSAVKKEGIYFAGQVGKPANLPLSFENKACNKLVVEASLPSSGDWTDAYGCVKKEGTITGSIKFHAKSTKWQGSVSVPVTIKIVRQAKNCNSPAALDKANSLHSFFVNYADSVLSFKAPGHYRFVILANNLLEPATISSNLDSSSPIKCDFPQQLAPGEAKLAKCISLKPAENFQLKITAKPARAASLDFLVKVNVFNAQDSVYDSTPLGELAPQTTQQTNQTAAQSPPQAYYVVCEKYFCNAAQASTAYSSFLAAMKSFLDSVTADAATHQRFCQSTVGSSEENALKVVEKTIVIQKTAATQSIAEFNEQFLKTAREILPDYASGENFFQGIPSESIAGCGWYKVSVALDACKEMGSHASQDWKKRVGLRVRIERMSESDECKPTLANALLFLKASSPDSLGVTVGNRVAVWPDEVSGKRLLSVVDKTKENWDKVKASQPSTWLYLFDVGVLALGPYADQADEADVKTAQTLYQMIYGQQAKSAAKSTYYDDATFCSANAPQQLKWIAVGGSSLAAAGTLLAFLPAGASQVVSAFLVPLGLKLAAGTATTAALCVGSAAAYGEKGTCARYNDCIRSAIFGAATAAIPTAGELAAFKTASAALKTTAALTASTAGVVSAVNLLAPDGPETTDATIPLVATGYAAATTVSFSRAQARAASPVAKLEQQGALLPGSPFGREVESLIAQGTSWEDAVASAREKLVAEKAQELARMKPSALGEIAYAHSIDPALAASDAAVQKSLATAIVLEETRPASVLQQMENVKLFNGKIQFAEPAFAAGAGILPQQQAKLTQLLDPKSFAQQTPSQAFLGLTDAEKTVFKAAAEKTSKARNALVKSSNAFKAGAQIGATLLFQVDARPVMAKLDPALPTHFVAYHLTRKGDSFVPTAFKLCVTEKRVGVEPDEDGCVKGQSFYLADLCNSDYSACLYETPVYTSSPSAPAYNLVVAVNDERIDAKALLESVFLPDAKPLTANIGGGTLSPQKIAELAQTRNEKGSGKAFAGK
ncbi:MAG: hypothetical protein ACP5IG_03570 [Candidatus Micrarchaeia archaeon]|jgi:hypothetical protein